VKLNGDRSNLPRNLSEEISAIAKAATAIHLETATQTRHAMIRAAAKHGVSAQELIQRGILAPEPKRNGAST
jgi:hypothetical protein